MRPRGERLRTRLEHGFDRRSVPLAVWLLRATRGRMARLWRRRALVLNVRGRRSGRPRSVPLQYFPDGEAMVVVAANSGLPTLPAWYLNLLADPAPSVDVDGRRLAVRAERMSAEEAAAFWPKLLGIAPDYERYLRRTTREIPLVRLSAASASAPGAAASTPPAD